MSKLIDKLMKRNPMSGCYLAIGFRSDQCPCNMHGSEMVWPYTIRLFPSCKSPRDCTAIAGAHNDCTMVVVLRINADWTVTEVYGDISGLPPSDTWNEVCKPAMLAIASAMHLLAMKQIASDIYEYTSSWDQYIAINRFFPSNRCYPKE